MKPLTPHAKHVLMLANLIAAELGNEHITTVAILIALIRNQSGCVGLCLHQVGITEEWARGIFVQQELIIRPMDDPSSALPTLPVQLPPKHPAAEPLAALLAECLSEVPFREVARALERHWRTRSEGTAHRPDLDGWASAPFAASAEPPHPPGHSSPERSAPLAAAGEYPPAPRTGQSPPGSPSGTGSQVHPSAQTTPFAEPLQAPALWPDDRHHMAWPNR